MQLNQISATASALDFSPSDGALYGAEGIVLNGLFSFSSLSEVRDHLGDDVADTVTDALQAVAREQYESKLTYRAELREWLGRSQGGF